MEYILNNFFPEKNYKIKENKYETLDNKELLKQVVLLKIYRYSDIRLKYNGLYKEFCKRNMLTIVKEYCMNNNIKIRAHYNLEIIIKKAKEYNSYIDFYNDCRNTFYEAARTRKLLPKIKKEIFNIEP